VHWRELPAAIHPDHLGSIYSGSAVVDHLNTTGFQVGSEPPIVAVYTSAGSRNRWSLGRKFTQSLAYSNDRGRTFTPYEGNPVRENLGYINRDPKAFWYEPGGHWVIVLYLDHGAFAFFTSADLLDWERKSTLEIGDLGIREVAAFEDCPELFQLAVDGDPENTLWVLYAGSGDYVLGSFDGSTFSPTSGLLPYNQGDCFYASQTFNNTGAKDGRRIQMAWGTVDFPGMPFNQMMNFPVELSLRRTEKGIRMHANPVEEIEALYLDTRTWEKVELLPGQVFQPADKAGLYDLQMEIHAGSTSLVQMTFNGREISYDAKKHRLYSEEQEATLSPLDGSIHLRILVDRMSVEIFGNRGQVYMPLQTGPEGIGKAMEFTCEKGSAKLTGFTMHKLETIWLP
jgi:sucrose-6-phosphate hydrolase SacC (GH32 family)